MRFSPQDVEQFAAWSGDRNPLHVDAEFARQTHFGQPVVHGVLSVLRAIDATAAVTGSDAVGALDIDFRGAVTAGPAYEADAAPVAGGFEVRLRATGSTVLSVRVETTAAAASRPAPDTSWATAAALALLGTESGFRRQAQPRSLSELKAGVEVRGVYRTLPAPEAYASRLPVVQARVLALCSYLTGMELPGLRSLFTRLSITFAAAEDAPELCYRARTVTFDATFRLLETELHIVRPDGTLVAVASLRSYVPFSPVESDMSRMAAHVAGSRDRLRGKVALVCGGTRGLGADLTTALVLAGCDVYASSRRNDAAARQLEARFEAQGARATFLQGDAGNSSWCAETIRTIMSRHGRIDLLILNACAPPVVGALDSASGASAGNYIADNIRLVEAPLAAAAAALAESGGAVVHVSSSFVDTSPAGFAHYVAVKQAGEALVRTVARERAGLYAYIVRPPVLQTRWNDTPTGVLGSIASDAAALRIVNGVAEAWRPGGVGLLTDFTVAAPVADSVPAERADADFTLRVAASFTTDPLLPPLRWWLDELGVNAAVEVAPYGQLLQPLLDPAGLLSSRSRGFNAVLLRVADWLRELPADALADAEALRDYLTQTRLDFEQAMRAHRAHASSETLLLLCPSTGDAPAAQAELLAAAEQAIVTALADLPGLQVTRAAAFDSHYGVAADGIADPLRHKLAHIPYVDSYLHTLATIVIRHVYRKLSAPRKAVVVDCDHTLWNGVVGEVGEDGITFDTSHRALHDTLVRLNAAGVLVCLCSKNEEADVWRVFDTRHDWALRREHVVAATINWAPKSQNLKTLAARLNLGLDSFIFIDDNPVECAEVRAGCPEVLTLEWPRDPQRALQLLRHTWEFDPSRATKEDERRTQLYREEFKRQEARAETLTFEDFIAKLQLAVDIDPLTAEDVRRASQLTLRTNQFNFTTRRRDEAELLALQTGGGHEIRTVRVRDRFGDYGLVGLMIAERQPERWTLDTLLLSCRVLGRGVEHKLVADLGRLAAEAGAREVEMRVAFTSRNTPARSFLESLAAGGRSTTSSDALDCVLTVEAMAAARFAPTTMAEEPVADEGGGASTRSTVNPAAVRRREQQIARAAFELADATELGAAVTGRSGVAENADAGAIAGVVYGAFAAALRTSVDQVQKVDRLDALGCESMRIVEITVALSAKYPWLPTTLLFEHRTVSEVISAITALSQPQRHAAAVVNPLPDDSRRQPAVSNDIAVVGIDLRCAGASSPTELWELLSTGSSAVGRVPSDRTHFFHPLRDDREHFAGLLDHPDEFDNEFFRISPREAQAMDPQLRLFLQIAWGALEDAGCTQADLDTATGVFVGVMYGDYREQANQALVDSKSSYRSWEGFSLANRLSQVLGLRGPSMAIDTACSSSATALHLACRALQSGDCRAAVVGGVNLIFNPDRFVSLGRLGILSTSGQCQAFGDAADGTVLGEGVAAVVLRRLDDAVERGDRIYGVIKGSGVSVGSGTVGFTAPNPQAQADAIRHSLRNAGVDPRTISYIETHGTGTALGDPIEVRGLALAYGDATLHTMAMTAATPCSIGSIKPNVGHLEAGAGILGLIKVLLQMQRGRLVPSLSSPRVNPQIGFDSTPFTLQRALQAWNRPRVIVGGREVEVPRRAGLNSFGVGGANVHLIVEEPAIVERAAASPGRTAVVPLSGQTEAELANRLTTMAAWLEGQPDEPLADIAFTAGSERRHYRHRAAIVTGTSADAAAAMREAAAGRESAAVVRGQAGDAAPRVAFVFTGQGSQYPGMGRALYESQPVFRAAMDACADILDRQLETPLLRVMFAAPGSAEAALLDQTAYTQPALFVFEYAACQMWQSWGVHPDVVLGHSVGEVAAACAAGALSLADGLTLIAARGRLMQALPPGGSMVSVQAGEALVAERLLGYEDRVSIAAVNGPAQIVISGDRTAIAEIAGRFTADGIKTTRLSVSHAFHSPLMRPMLDAFEAVVRSLSVRPAAIPIIRAIDGKLSPASMDPSDWVGHVMAPVRFSDAMQTADSLGMTVFLEVGPQPVLLGMGRACLPEGVQAWLPTARKDADVWRTVLGSVARLYSRGGTVDWRALAAPQVPERVSLPRHPFAAKHFWIEPRPRVVSVATSEHLSHQQVLDIVWEERPVLDAPADPAGQHWLLFADRQGVAAALSGELERRGARTTSVLRREMSGALLGAIEPWDRVAYLWALDSDDADAVGAGVPAATHAVMQDALVATQALLDAASVHPAPVWFITRGSVAVTNVPDHELHVAQGPLWGLARTLALEHPVPGGGIVDLAPGGSDHAAMRQLVDLISAPAGWCQAALRNGRAYSPVLRERTVRAAEPVVLDPAGAYLVTGGLGVLGLHVARWLAAAGARQIVLTGRRGLDAPGAVAAVAALEHLGATVTVEQADVSQPADVDRLLANLASRRHPLRGIVHAAGVDAAMPLAAMTPAALDDMLRAKVDGAWLLHQASHRQALDFFVCFSSMAAVVGSSAHAHYSAANAFLDTLVHERQRTGLPALSVNWGPWSGGGMASETELRQFERIGNHGLAPGAALETMAALIGTETAQVMVADVDWHQFAGVYAGRGASEMFAALAAGSEAAVAAAPARLPAAATVPALPAGDASLLDALREEVAATLGFSRADLPDDKSFFDLGMDSLSVVELAQRLQRRFGLTSCAPLIFDHPRLEALASAIGARLPEAVASKQTVVVAAGMSRGTAAALLEAPVSVIPQRPEIVALLRAEVATVLGYTDPREVPSGVALTALGMDSLGAADLMRRLQTHFGAPLAAGALNQQDIEALADHLMGAVTPPSSSGVVAYDTRIEAEILAFQRQAFPARRDDWVDPRWRWMFLASARRLDVAPQFWCYRDASAIVGQVGAIPVRVKLGARERPAAWLVETMVLPEYRGAGHAVGVQLTMSAHDDVPFGLSLGQTELMRDIQLRLGWQQVGTLQTAQLLLRPERVLKSKVGAPAALVAGAGFRALAAARRVRSVAGVAGAMREVSRFGAGHDRLWATAALDLSCAVVRDASYLNWKYVEQPGQEFLRLELVHDGLVRGVIVCMVREPDDVYQYRRAFIVDMVVPLGEQGSAHSLIAGAVRALAERECDAVTCLHTDPRVTAALQGAGFMMREPDRVVLVRSHPADPQPGLDSEQTWYVMQGDSDIDRPW